MTNPYETRKDKKEVPPAIDRKTDGFDLEKMDQAIGDSNAETASMEAVVRENDLAKVREIEARFGLNTDKTEGIIMGQVQKLKELGKSIHSKIKSVVGSKTDAGLVGEEKERYDSFFGKMEKAQKEYDSRSVYENARLQAERMRRDLLVHLSSLEYLEKLKIEYGGNELEARKYQKIRIKNLKEVKITILSEDAVNKRYKKEEPNGKSSVGGFYTSDKHEIVVPVDDSDGAVIHELLHASIRNFDANISYKTKKLLKRDSYEAGNDNNTPEYGDDYFQSSAERLVRKQVLDLELEKLGVKKYGEKITDRHIYEMINLYRQGKLSQDATEFIERTKLEYFKNIFNEVAMMENSSLSGSADVVIGDEDSSDQNDVPDEEQEKKSKEFENHMEEVERKAMEIKESLLQRIGSQEYLDRLTVEFDGNEKEAQKSQMERMENLKQVKIEFLSLGQMKTLYGYDDPKGSRVAAFYDEKEHRISFAYDQKMDDLSDSMLHEFIHASMKQEKEMTLRAKEMLSGSYQYLEGKSQKINAYLKSSNERIARKQQVDAEMEKLGIKKYGEEFTDEHYAKLKELYLGGKLSRNVKIFFETTKPDDFKKIFNEIAKNEESPDLSVAA